MSPTHLLTPGPGGKGECPHAPAHPRCQFLHCGGPRGNRCWDLKRPEEARATDRPTTGENGVLYELFFSSQLILNSLLAGDAQPIRGHFQEVSFSIQKINTDAQELSIIVPRGLVPNILLPNGSYIWMALHHP